MPGNNADAVPCERLLKKDAMMEQIDVLCVGHASHDLVFSVGHHPGPDEKTIAGGFISCGGGPAANASVAAARLGYRAAFAGYLGNDIFGEKHLQELQDEEVHVGFVERGSMATPLSTILVKPDGSRTVINYRGDTQPLTRTRVDLSGVMPKTLLFDGHEPGISPGLAKAAGVLGIPTVLDAGSLHRGTRALLPLVGHVVASEKFAGEYAHEKDMGRALAVLGRDCSSVVITMGGEGLIWKTEFASGTLEGFVVDAVDTTGAGDTFHGAFCAGLSCGMAWEDLLRFASAAGALCCTRKGARVGIPTASEVDCLLNQHNE
jgi:sulfofructose kinase